MNTRRMTPTELLAIIDKAGVGPIRAAQMACCADVAVLYRYLPATNRGGMSDLDCPAPISRLLCIHLLFEGLAVDLARPWVPDELAAVLAPII